MRRHCAVLASVGAALALPIAGCGGSLSATDGGRGDGGGQGGLDAAIPAELKLQLDGALATWAAASSACPIYSYDRRFNSAFGGATSTEVEIQNDIATRRRYWMSPPSAQFDGGGRGWTQVWDETAGHVGEHPSLFPPYPADGVAQLLWECESILARDPTTNQLTLTVDARGVPTTCTYYPSDCFDDCLVGITIQSFACAPLSAPGPS